MSLIHSVVGWSVFVFCVPSTLCCELVDVLYPFFTLLWLVSIHVLCPFYTVFLVGWSFLFCVPSTPCFVVSWPLCSVSLLHCVLGWLVFVFCVPSSLCCGLVGVLCPFYNVFWVGQCSVSLLHCVVDGFVFCVPSTHCCGLVSVFVLFPLYTKFWVGWCLCFVPLLHCVVGWSVILLSEPSML